MNTIQVHVHEVQNVHGTRASENAARDRRIENAIEAVYVLSKQASKGIEHFIREPELQPVPLVLSEQEFDKFDQDEPLGRFYASEVYNAYIDRSFVVAAISKQNFLIAAANQCDWGKATYEEVSMLKLETMYNDRYDKSHAKEKKEFLIRMDRFYDDKIDIKSAGTVDPKDVFIALRTSSFLPDNGVDNFLDRWNQILYRQFFLKEIAKTFDDYHKTVNPCRCLWMRMMRACFNQWEKALIAENPLCFDYSKIEEEEDKEDPGVMSLLVTMSNKGLTVLDGPIHPFALDLPTLNAVNRWDWYFSEGLHGSIRGPSHFFEFWQDVYDEFRDYVTAEDYPDWISLPRVDIPLNLIENQRAEFILREYRRIEMMPFYWKRWVTTHRFD